jgi:hypothetical protein
MCETRSNEGLPQLRMDILPFSEEESAIQGGRFGVQTSSEERPQGPPYVFQEGVKEGELAGAQRNDTPPVRYGCAAGQAPPSHGRRIIIAARIVEVSEQTQPGGEADLVSAAQRRYVVINSDPYLLIHGQGAFSLKESAHSNPKPCNAPIYTDRFEDRPFQGHPLP